MNKEKEKKNAELSARITKIINNLGLSRNSFALQLGYPRAQTIYDIIDGKSAPSYDFFRLFMLSEFSERFNLDWLITGRGEMLRDNVEENIPIARSTQNFGEGIPLIPFSAMAGVLSGEQSVLDYECERYVVPAFSGADFLITIKGNSMTPTYFSGDIVACQRVPMSGFFFQWNKPYVLDTSQGVIIKRIKPGSDKEHVLIVSDNKDYDSFEISREDIFAVALVIGIIRLE